MMKGKKGNRYQGQKSWSQHYITAAMEELTSMLLTGLMQLARSSSIRNNALSA
jgi:hypothetical protein